MQSNVAGPALRAAFAALVDYAGLFPPAKLPMREAAEEYTASRRGPYAWMLGRFIVPLSRLPELLAAVPANERFPASVILDGGIAGVSEAARLHAAESGALAVESLEIVLAPAEIDTYVRELQAAGLEGIPSYVEFARDTSWRTMLPEAMQRLAACGLGAKVRCGGLQAAAFPSPEDLAAFVYAASVRRVRFKATAGLHHPIRHFNAPSGFTMHGFLNLLTASALACDGAAEAELVQVLAQEAPVETVFDERGLQFGNWRVPADLLQRSRRDAFAGYGSCSFSEPVEDLRALELLP